MTPADLGLAGRLRAAPTLSASAANLGETIPTYVLVSAADRDAAADALERHEPHGCKALAAHEAARLQADNARLTRERDEARRAAQFTDGHSADYWRGVVKAVEHTSAERWATLSALRALLDAEKEK